MDMAYPATLEIPVKAILNQKVSIEVLMARALVLIPNETHKPFIVLRKPKKSLHLSPKQPTFPKLPNVVPKES